MDKNTALSFIQRIEDHRAAEDKIWSEMRSHPNYEMHEDKIVLSVIEAHAKVKEILDEADSEIESFNWSDENAGEIDNN